MYNDSWVVDFGVLFYAICHMIILHNYVHGDFGKVYLRDAKPCNIVGKDDGKINLLNVTSLHL